MTPGISWRHVAEPAGRWLLKKLPTAIFARYYSPPQLRDDIKIRLASAAPVVFRLPAKLKAASLEINLEAFNMSPHLDVDVTAIRSFLSADGEAGGDVFAQLDDWGGFYLPRGESRPCMLTYWLSASQMEVVQECLRGSASLRVTVILWADSRIGVVRPSKIFQISQPIVRS